jgi:hypothetical protein
MLQNTQDTFTGEERVKANVGNGTAKGAIVSQDDDRLQICSYPIVRC